jgi:RNA-splicing ligase RtcB
VKGRIDKYVPASLREERSVGTTENRVIGRRAHREGTHRTDDGAGRKCAEGECERETQAQEIARQDDRRQCDERQHAHQIDERSPRDRQ